jgi:hypothetical protein
MLLIKIFLWIQIFLNDLHLDRQIRRGREEEGEIDSGRLKIKKIRMQTNEKK